MSPFWILVELSMMELVVVTTGAVRRAHAVPVKSSLPTTNTQFFTGRMPFLSPNQQCQSTAEKYRIPSFHGLDRLRLDVGVFRL